MADLQKRQAITRKAEMKIKKPVKLLQHRMIYKGNIIKAILKHPMLTSCDKT